MRNRRDVAIPVEPGRLELSHHGLVLHEADGGRKVVEEPGEATIVEVDHTETRAVDEEIGQLQKRCGAWSQRRSDARAGQRTDHLAQFCYRPARIAAISAATTRLT